MMEIIYGWKDVPQRLKNAALAIGNFDGVHRGHQTVLDLAVAAAREHETVAGVMVFEPHPRKFFQPDKPLFRLTTLERKLELFAAYSLDFTAVLPFDAKLASFSAEEFVTEILVRGFQAAHVVTGYDFFFGKGRDGNADMLREFGKQYRFAVSTVTAAGATPDEAFSSTRIRELLAEGDPRGAAEMLGHWWRVKGIVRRGAGVGTGLGFPTANITMEEGQALKHGIYAARIYTPKGRYFGAAYLGTRPTFDAGPPLLEVYLFDFTGDLYGETIEIEFIDSIRGDAKFASAEELAVQMRKDCEKAREILQAVERDDPLARFPLSKALNFAMAV